MKTVRELRAMVEETRRNERYDKKEEILEMLEATDRQSAGPTAPAHGLTMIGIEYKEV